MRKLNAISGPSMFYQHIVTVSKYDTNVNQEISTLLPGEPQTRVTRFGDFTSIQTAVDFENLNSHY